MSEYESKYDPNDETNADILQRMLEDVSSEDGAIEDSDDDLEDDNIVEERVVNSESEESAESSNDDNVEDNQEYFLGKDGTSKWLKRPSKQTTLRSHNILQQSCGVIGAASTAVTSLEAWSCFFTDDILDNIVIFTNQHIELISGRFNRERDVKATDKAEIKAFFALLYLAGILRSNRQSLEELWSSDGFGIEFFRLVMSIKRFKLLIRCLRFDDCDSRAQRRASDNIAPIRGIFTIFVNNCQKNYSLGPNVTVDEKLEAFQGNCCFKQYISSKRAKYGIKIFALVDAQTYYTANLEIYAGKQPEGRFEISNKPTDVVKRLVIPILESGRNITADNWFTSVPLVQYLKEQKLSYVGTIKKDKTELPFEFVATRSRAKASSLFGFSNDLTIVSYVPKKNKNITVISSLHSDNSIDERTKEPDIITFYNKTKSGVDVVDKLSDTYNVARNTRRWPMVVLFSMLNTAAINSQIVTGKNANIAKRRRLFLRDLVTLLAAEHIDKRRLSKSGTPKYLQLRLKSYAKSQEDQVPKLVQDNPEENTAPKRKSCSNCASEKRRRLTQYLCKMCGEGQCLQHALTMCQECFSKFTQNDSDSNSI